jgi:hypothetical protein
MKLTILSNARHRNGVDGAPFDAVIFREKGRRNRRKLAILFDEPGHSAVFDIAKLTAGDIAFGSNSWRGDEYEMPLRSFLDILATPTTLM